MGKRAERERGTDWIELNVISGQNKQKKVEKLLLFCVSVDTRAYLFGSERGDVMMETCLFLDHCRDFSLGISPRSSGGIVPTAPPAG